MTDQFCIVGWNIRAGGGKRVQDIAEQLRAWQTDIAVLSEFRAGATGDALISHLDGLGLVNRRAAVHQVKQGTNAVLIASRWPLRSKRSAHTPDEPGRFVLADVNAPKPFSLAGVHIPNQVTGRKPQYHDALLALAANWSRRPLLIIGDTNSGKRDLDEERPVFNRRTHRWMEEMESADARDLFRELHGEKREYTWYSANGGNGFRLDQGFANRPFRRWVQAVGHFWGGDGSRREQLSDHAALIITGSFAA